jgi:hypothetical protein
VAVPTIDSISPATGPTGGLTLVDIVGSGFRLPPAPPPAGPTPPLRATVEVLVNGRRALDVQLLSPGRLTARTPPGDAGAADFVVRNLDDASRGSCGRSCATSSARSTRT